jgi:predicted Zn-dependent protease with MMP-like domain
MEREEFRALVVAAVKSLPRLFRKRMENISVVVEDYPSREDVQKTGASRLSLLGLYQGVPLGKRSVWQNQTMPDKISIFQANIERTARTPEEVQALVREVVMHEIGHYFGLNEDELREAMEKE